VAAGVCGALVLAGFSLALPYLSRHTAGGPGEEKGGPENPAEVMEAGRRALAQGKFHVARALLDRAAAQRGLRGTARHRELGQLRRQADLLARLSPRPLEGVVRHALLVRDPEEWDAQFADDYLGRTVVFDDVVRRDDEGRPRLGNYAVEVEDEPVRVALEDLAVLRDLPLEDGPRLIFGARLLRCRREEAGTWVIRFEPDSGVLLTDPAAVEACFPLLTGDGFQATLERQQRWLDERAGAPARP
jgi:hypothetical protein